MLDEALKPLDDPRLMYSAIEAERLLFGEWVFSREHNEEFPNLVDAPACGPSRFALRLYASPLGLPLWQWDHACYLQVMGEMPGALQRPYSQGDRGLGDVQLRSVPRICVATRLLVPGLGSVKVKQLEYLARVRLARVGLALRAARSAGQALPAELSGLATAGLDLTDPFTGKPFVYRPSENGFVVYSLAENQTDDGGTPRPARPASKDREKGWDLVWSFPPEPARAAGQ
jgi:hypothetical protein